MKDTAKTRAQLIAELESLRQRITLLEAAVTECKHVEQALQAEKDRAQKYLDIAGVILVAIDVQQKVTMINRRGCDILGYEEKDILGKNWFDHFLPERIRPELKHKFKQIIAGEIGLSRYSVDSILTRDGEERTISWSIASITDTHGRLVGILASGQDITDRQRWEDELKLRAQLLDGATDSIFLLDFDGNIVYANQMTYQCLGYTREELLTMNISQLDPPGYNKVRRQYVKELLTKGQAIFEFAQLRKDGSIMPVEVSTRIIESGGNKFIMGIIRDLTERRKMQERLVIADRLASLGELASGFAHELNNPLTGVIGYAQLLLEDKTVPENIRKDVERIYSSAKRVDNVIKNFLIFARKQPPLKQPADINVIITSMLKLREYEHKLNNIDVVTQFGADLPPIMADTSQLQQVLLNIIINAEYFMLKNHNQGTLSISTQRNGDRVKATLTDDGPGISKENLDRIFNPFFTTKEVGQGTGLGLSICHGIIGEHGGRIYAESESGKGTTFVVELPVASG